MSLSDRILDLSLRKVINRGRSILGLGGLGLAPSTGVNELLGEKQALEISVMPRYVSGEVNFDNVALAFNDNVALLGMLDEIYVRQNYAFSSKQHLRRY